MKKLFAILLMLIMLPLPLSAQQKFEKGKMYHAVYSCATYPVAPQVMIPSCYEEFWLVLNVGKDGWLEVNTWLQAPDGTLKQTNQVWWVNTRMMASVRQMQNQAQPTPKPIDLNITSVATSATCTVDGACRSD